jgi:drug/metabolite transporter (DMT)-like permease
MKNDKVPLGIAMMLGSVILFMILNALVKLLGERYPVNQLVFFRSAFAMIPVVTVMMMQGGVGTLKTGRFGGHIWRTVLGLTSMMLLFWSYILLPLAKAVALNFSSPLIITALSVPLLGERVGIHRWSAVVFGFIGVLVMLKPDGEVALFGSAVALAAAAGQAFAVTTVRQLSRTERANTIVFYFTILTTLASALSLPFSWEPIASWQDFGLFALAGLAGGFAQLLMTRAYALAPTSVISPFNYISIVLAAALGWLLWAETPTANTMIGSVLVIASGLYILYREAIRKLPPRIDVPVGE